MKKILPAIIGITLAGGLATCTQKDSEKVVQTPQNNSPKVAPVNTPPETLITQKKGDVAIVSPESVNKEKIATPNPTPPTKPASSINTTERNVKYKTPGGLHSVTFNVSILDGKISGARITPSADHDVSKKFQAKFAEEINEKIIGKDVKNLKLDTIAGASLTTKAFNEFLVEL